MKKRFEKITLLIYCDFHIFIPKMLPKTHSFLLELLFVLSVSVKLVDSKHLASSDEGDNFTYLHVNDRQKERLAHEICRESFEFFFNFDDVAIDKCKENFGWQVDDADQGPGVVERCRAASGSSVYVTETMEVPTYNSFQILLLIPNPNDNSELIYNIVNINTKYTDGMVIPQGKNYTMYSTRLDETFTPVLWRREANLLVRVLPAKKIYDVQVKFNVTSDSIDGLLTWNQTGELDACFELDVACQSRSFSKKISPDSLPGVVIKSLPPNESCNTKLRGLYGTTDITINIPAYEAPDTYSVEIPGEPGYNKPSDRTSLDKAPYEVDLKVQSHEASLDEVSSEELAKVPDDDNIASESYENNADNDVDNTRSYVVLNDSHSNPGFNDVKPDPWVEDIHVSEEQEEDGEKWTIHVSWLKPAIIPDMYNVTIWGTDVFAIVPGNVTEVDLRRVQGTGLYNVSVYAIVGTERHHNNGRGIFPSPIQRGAGAGVIRWAVAAGGAWAAAALATLLYWLRSCRANIMPQLKPTLSTEGKSKEPPLEESVVELPPAVDAWEIKPERLTLREVIGEGAFGVVRRGTLSPAEKEVAVKMLKDFPTLEEMRAFHLEMELMKSVGAHPHVVSLVGCCSIRQPAIVAEYCSRGDLLNFLRCSWDVMVSKRNANYYNNNINTSDYRNDLFKCTQPQEHSRLVVNKMYDLQGVCDTELTSLDLLSFCRQIAMGMEFLSLNKVVHRDLAARNVLVTGDKTLKIADFGLSRDVYQENQYTQKGNGKMPIKWMALESLTRRIYTSQSDVWSFGVVVWEVVTVGGAPYAGVEAARLPRLLRAGYRMPRPPNCSHQLYELMRSCWAARPRDRPTFAELHARLDDLLNSASADEYLSLELDEEPPPAPHHHRYFRMILRAKRSWTRGESYERPLKAPHNHYTTPPVTYKTPV